MNKMFEHVKGKTAPAKKRDGWKSKTYDVDQTRRLKAANHAKE